MKGPDFSTSILVDRTPSEVFAAINNVRGWWSEGIEGHTDRLGAEFTYRYKDVYLCKMHIVEFVPNKKIVWLVRDNYFSFTADQTEWKGTKIILEISRTGGNSQIRFTHQGLVPTYECYNTCSRGLEQLYSRQPAQFNCDRSLSTRRRQSRHRLSARASVVSRFRSITTFN